jgi:hypothetical protein
MNIKSLLLGSAAALVAVSGARAADAIVAAEPEPVEYVRVCDAFGTGYFYIPGTETCLRIHGYIRYDIGAGELFERATVTGDETYNKRARVSVRTSTASETELGTLRLPADPADRLPLRRGRLLRCSGSRKRSGPGRRYQRRTR